MSGQTTTEESEEQRQARRARRRRRRRNRRVAVFAIAAVAAVAAIASGASPTGWTPADAAWNAGLAVIVTLGTSRSRRWPACWLAGGTLLLAAITSSGWAVLPALIAVGVSIATLRSSNRDRIVGAAIGALSVQSLLRLGDLDPVWLTVVVTGVVAGPALWSGYTHATPPARRATRWALVGGLTIVAVTTVGMLSASIAMRSKVDRAHLEAQAGLDSLRDGDHQAAAERFDASAQAFADAAEALDAPWAVPGRAFPVLAPNAEVARDLAHVGESVAASAATTAAVAPYHELRSSEGRIDLALIEDMQGPVASSVDTLVGARDRAAALDSPWLLPMVDTRLDRLVRQLDGTIPEAQLAAEVLQAAPSLLGGEGPRTYLVLFTSPAESRYLGGFTGAYGLLHADDGSVELTETGSIPEANRANRVVATIDHQEEFVDRYGEYEPERFLQNLTASPDFPTDAQVAMQVWPQATGTEVDAVLAIDPIALGALLELTGPIRVPDIGRLTAETAPDHLLRQQYELFGEDDTDERRDSLTDIATATFEALTSRELPGPRQVAARLSGPVDEHRLLLWDPDPAHQDLFARLGLLGAFEPTTAPGDYLSIRTANTAPNKIDAYLERDVDYRATVDPATGALDATLTVTFTNDAPAAGLSDYVIGNRFGGPSGTNYLDLAIFSPHEVIGADVDGELRNLADGVERGSPVRTTTLAIPPGEQVVLTVQFEGSVATDGPYLLDLYSQPLVNPDHVTVSVGTSNEDFRVDRADGLEAVGVEAEGDIELTQDRSFAVEFGAR